MWFERLAHLSKVRPEECVEGVRLLSDSTAEIAEIYGWQKEFRDAELLLAGIRRRLTRRSLRAGDLRLPKRLLANTAEVVQRRNIVLREFRARVKPSPLGVWERLWSQNARVKDINREIELDTRLQVQSAKMFRTFLHRDDGVSFRTIARLVVLVYFVTGLASRKKIRRTGTVAYE